MPYVMSEQSLSLKQNSSPEGGIGQNGRVFEKFARGAGPRLRRNGESSWGQLAKRGRRFRENCQIGWLKRVQNTCHCYLSSSPGRQEADPAHGNACRARSIPAKEPAGIQVRN